MHVMDVKHDLIDRTRANNAELNNNSGLLTHHERHVLENQQAIMNALLYLTMEQ
jgi:hypothetical protein